MADTYDPKSCNALEKPYYRPVEAALRWCGLIEHEVEIMAKVGSSPVPELTDFPQWPCLRANAEKIYDAMLNGELPFGRDGKKVEADDHVAPNRRTVRHTDLKLWMAQHYPDQKPPFLFDEVERTTHASISVETFQALQAERDALKARLDRAVDVYRSTKEQLGQITAERDALLLSKERLGQVSDPRSEVAHLNVIGGLVTLMLSTSPGGNPQSVFKDQAAIIDALLANFGSHYGIAKRTLEEKFSAANKSLRQV